MALVTAGLAASIHMGFMPWQSMLPANVPSALAQFVATGTCRYPLHILRLAVGRRHRSEVLYPYCVFRTMSHTDSAGRARLVAGRPTD